MITYLIKWLDQYYKGIIWRDGRVAKCTALEKRRALTAYRGFESLSLRNINKGEFRSPGFLIIALTIICGSSSVGRARLFQSRGREFEPRLPLYGEKRITLAGRQTRILEPDCLRTWATDHRIMRRSAVRPPTYIGALVQLVRMLPCHGRGHGFESRTHRHNDMNLMKEDDFVAQQVEQLAFNQWAMGSSPIGVTKHYSRLLMVFWLFVFFHGVIQVCFSVHSV